jgi:hypothetical protein
VSSPLNPSKNGTKTPFDFFVFIAELVLFIICVSESEFTGLNINHLW